MKIANVGVKMVVHYAIGSVPSVGRNYGNEFDMYDAWFLDFTKAIWISLKAFKGLDDFAGAGAFSHVREKSMKKSGDPTRHSREKLRQARSLSVSICDSLGPETASHRTRHLAFIAICFPNNNVTG
jgi:hypothetical protein